jgi:hypothetical protein
MGITPGGNEGSSVADAAGAWAVTEGRRLLFGVYEGPTIKRAGPMIGAVPNSWTRVALVWRSCGAIVESQRSGLNRRPLDYESSALPLSYAGASVAMPWRGLEPRRLSAPPPQDGVSTNFTTRAKTDKSTVNSLKSTESHYARGVLKT